MTDQLVRVHAVVDANIVQAELRWRLGSRKNPDARSSLEESLDAGLLVLIAPTALHREITAHFSRMARDTGVNLDQVETEWRKFRPKLRFYEPSVLGRIPGKVVDPDDLPYKRTSEELGFPIYTRDTDLVEMGASVIFQCIDAALRDHARSRAVTLGITAGSAYSLAATVGLIHSAIKLVRKLFQGYAKLPDWAQILIVGAVAAVIIHPKSRGKLGQLWRSYAGLPDELKAALLDTAVEVAERFSLAENSAKESKAKIEKALPSPQRLSAIVYARRILLLEAPSSSLSAIARRMKALGFVTQSKDFESYLRRVLRNSDQFVEVRRDVWRLSCVPETLRQASSEL